MASEEEEPPAGQGLWRVGAMRPGHMCSLGRDSREQEAGEDTEPEY